MTEFAYNLYCSMVFTPHVATCKEYLMQMVKADRITSKPALWPTLRSAIKVFSELSTFTGAKLTLYNTHIVEPYLALITEYYTVKGNFWRSNSSCPELFATLDRFATDEVTRVEAYLHTGDNMADKVRQELLAAAFAGTDTLRDVLESSTGLPNLIDAYHTRSGGAWDDIGDVKKTLQSIFRLTSLSPVLRSQVSTILCGIAGDRAQKALGGEPAGTETLIRAALSALGPRDLAGERQP